MVIGIRYSGVIIVAIRGTYDAYDCVVDADCRLHKYADQRANSQYLFHSGFLNAVKSIRHSVGDELTKWSAMKDVPIYFTGHSLGGAMAGIFNSIGAVVTNTKNYNVQAHMGQGYLFPDVTYTYGMPRFGDFETTNTRNINCLIHRKDIIPRLPPKILGFADPYGQYVLDNKTNIFISFNLWYSTVIYGIGYFLLVPALIELVIGYFIRPIASVVSNHAIENYKKSIENEYQLVPISV